MADIGAQLKEHLENAKDWENMETPIEGVSVVKIPLTKNRPSLLFVDVNPLKDDGKPMKRKGLFIGSKEMLVKFRDTMSDDKMYQLIGEIEKINPDSKLGNGTIKKLKM
ncbi:MAG: hypothetical protein ACTSRI_05710 [Promethearchaeota archaeon]